MEEGIWGLYHKYSGAELHVGRFLMEYRCMWVRKDMQRGIVCDVWRVDSTIIIVLNWFTPRSA